MCENNKTLVAKVEMLQKQLANPTSIPPEVHLSSDESSMETDDANTHSVRVAAGTSNSTSTMPVSAPKPGDKEDTNKDTKNDHNKQSTSDKNSENRSSKNNYKNSKSKAKSSTSKRNSDNDSVNSTASPGIMPLASSSPKKIHLQDSKK